MRTSEQQGAALQMLAQQIIDWMVRFNEYAADLDHIGVSVPDVDALVARVIDDTTLPADEDDGDNSRMFKIHPAVSKAIEEIDVALFSDNCFADPKENYLFAEVLARWQTRLWNHRESPLDKPAANTVLANVVLESPQTPVGDTNRS